MWPSSDLWERRELGLTHATIHLICGMGQSATGRIQGVPPYIPIVTGWNYNKSRAYSLAAGTGPFIMGNMSRGPVPFLSLPRNLQDLPGSVFPATFVPNMFHSYTLRCPAKTNVVVPLIALFYRKF
jgi:hypothetical protein